MAMLADSVEVVIGVDTHKQTHTAAVVAAATGQALANLTVPATPDGYRQLLELADQHHGQRVWAIEGTGGYGAGLTRSLAAHAEQVVELDRPKRAARRHGAKSDPLDAVRAAREVLGREQLAQPRATGPRAALSVRLAARRSAVQAAGDAQRQLHALVIAAPDVLRERLRIRSTRQLVAACARLRIQASWDVETATTAATLRSLARRIRELTSEAADHRQAILGLVRAWRPDLLARPGVGPIVAATVLCAWSHPGRCRSDAAFAMLGGGRPHPRLQRPDHPRPAESLRGPPAQPGPGHRGPDQAPHRPSDPRLRHPTARPRQDQPRDQTLPDPLHRPPALPTPRDPTST
jgi:transposase